MIPETWPYGRSPGFLHGLRSFLNSLGFIFRGQQVERSECCEAPAVMIEDLEGNRTYFLCTRCREPCEVAERLDIQDPLYGP